MTQYYTDISFDLTEGDYMLAFGPDFRLISKFGPSDLFFQRWLVEDVHAPEEFEGHLVWPVFTKGEDGSVTITAREKMPVRY